MCSSSWLWNQLSLHHYAEQKCLLYLWIYLICGSLQRLQRSSVFHVCTTDLWLWHYISTTCYWNPFPLQEPRICTGIVVFLTHFTQHPISIKLSGNKQWQKKADVQVSGRGGEQCPHLKKRETRRGMGLWKWLMRAQMAELWSGEKREEGKQRETRDNADSWAGLPVRPRLVFCLDLQVLDGTLTKASLENRNRCHKTLLPLGFAFVMTPLEMSRMMFITKTCQMYAQSGIHHQLSCNLQNVPSHHSDDGKHTNHVVYHCIWQNQTYCTC